MTTPPPPTDHRPWWRGWSDFWFRPSDPTTLGFMRICTGLLVLYIHMAYSLDLQAFFGERGWYSLDRIDRERREMPSFVSPFLDWDEPFAFPHLSDFPHRREAFMQFLKQTYLPDPNHPDKKPNPAAMMAYLNRVKAMDNPVDAHTALVYVEDMTDPQTRERRLKVLAGGKVEQSGIGTDAKKTDISASYKPPEVFANLTLEQRLQVVAEIEAFLKALDDVTWPASGRNYVFAHLREIPPDARRALPYCRYRRRLRRAAPCRAGAPRASLPRLVCGRAAC